jgi:hypothetical protein
MDLADRLSRMTDIPVQNVAIPALHLCVGLQNLTKITRFDPWSLTPFPEKPVESFSVGLISGMIPNDPFTPTGDVFYSDFAKLPSVRVEDLTRVSDSVSHRKPKTQEQRFCIVRLWSQASRHGSPPTYEGPWRLISRQVLVRMAGLVSSPGIRGSKTITPHLLHGELSTLLGKDHKVGR